MTTLNAEALKTLCLRDNLSRLLAFQRNNRTRISIDMLYYTIGPECFFWNFCAKKSVEISRFPFFTKFGHRDTPSLPEQNSCYVHVLWFLSFTVFFVPSYPILYKWAIKQKEKKQTFSFWLLFPSSWIVIESPELRWITSVFTARRRV